MHSVKRGVSACGLCVSVLVALGGVFGAAAAGTDGLSLTTNDWYDASFTALTVDTPIAQGGTVGITRGAGSWTAVPSSGTAKIVEDADNNSATVLAVNASGEELEFTPAALQNATGMETAQFRVKAEAVDALTAISDAQAAFALYSADGANYALMGYVSDGAGAVWTNLTGVTAGTLANTWYDLTMDFCGEGSARVVRFAVNGTILADSDGTTWFPVVKQNATTINSLAFTGVGSLQSFSGDSLAAASANVARYNGTDYPSVAAAIAAGEADSWANGSVTLLANAEWTPTAAGTYNIALGSYTLSNTGDYTISAGETAGTVTAARIYTWNGSSYTWLSAANWTVGSDAHAAATYPGENTTDPFTVVFTKNATFSSAEAVTVAARCNLVIEAEGYAVTMPTVTYGDTENYTYVNSGTVTLQNMSRDHVVVASGATLVVASNLNPSAAAFTWFTGTGTIVFDGITVSRANSEWGMTLRSFEGTYILKSGAVVSTTGNTQSNSAMLGTGKLVFAGATLRRSNDSNTLKNSSYEIVAGTANILNGESTSSGNVSYPHECFPLDLSKTTVVSGDAMLDAETQYVIMTVDSLSKFTGATLPAVSSDLTAAGWGVIRSTNGVGKAMLVLTHDPAYTWTGAAGDGLWATPENWKVGDYVPATAPGAGDTVAITDATVSVEKDSTLGVVTLAGTAKLSVIGVSGVTTATTVLPALSEGSTTLTADNIEIVGPYAVSFVDGAVQATRAAAAFIWNGGESGAWTASSWKIGDTAVLDYPTGKDDMAIFNANAALTIANSTVMSPITLNANLQLTSAATVYAGGDISGTGTLILSNVTLRTSGEHNKSVSFASPVNVPKGATATFEIDATSSDNGYKFTLSGKLTGGGIIDSHSVSSRNTYSGLNLTGDGSDFAGTVKLYSSSSQQRDAHVINPLASSSNAIWRINVDGSNENLSKMPFVEGTSYSETIYYMGACEIDFKNPNESVSGKFTLEVGALDLNSVIYTSKPSSDKSKYGNNTVLRWIAPTATITNAVSNLHILDIAGGGVAVVASSDLPQRIKFTGKGGVLKFAPTSTTPTDLASKLTYSDVDIVFDDEGESYTWATALASSNKGGLVKKGEGTLTLGAAPLYSGDTYLDGGTLKIPAAAGVAVKTHVSGKKVVTSAETIENVDYTVYTLGDKKPVLILVY